MNYRADKAFRMHSTLVIRLLVLCCAILFSHATAFGVIVGTNQVLINGGLVDFGNGSHSGGKPAAPGLVEWDFTPNASGTLIATVTVTGKLYLDTIASGHVQLRLEFLGVSGSTALATRTLALNAGPAFTGANHPSHQLQISETFSSSLLHRVRFWLQQVNADGSIQNWAKQTVNSPDRVEYTLGFGWTAPGQVTGSVQSFVFQRLNGNMSGTATLTSQWFSAEPGELSFTVDFLDFNNVLLERVVRSQAVPGTAANSSTAANSFNVTITSTQSLVRGRLFRARVSFNNLPLGLEYDFVSPFSVGTFEMSPAEIDVAPQERVNLAFTWTVPEPQDWRDLNSLQLRVVDGSDTVISIYFDEQSRTFALLDENAGRFSQFYAAGANRRLESPRATLHLRESSVQADGPTSPSVTLNLSLSFKRPLSGKWLAVEVAASDDEGRIGPFEPASTIYVH